VTSGTLAPPPTSAQGLARSSDNRGPRGSLQWSWQYRHLMRNLVVRDLKVRYRGSVLGFAWTFLNPLLMTVIFTFVLLDVFKVPAIGVPFPAFFLIGLLAWNFCVISIGGGLGSIVGNASIVSKVHFPRSILPVSVVLAGAVNFLLALLVTLPVIYILGVRFTWSVLFVPIILVAQILFLIGLALTLAVLNVLYRDTAPTVDVLTQAWFFLTPVIYDASALVRTSSFDIAALLVALNPMAAIITMYRAVLLDGSPPDAMLLVRTLLVCLGVCVMGVVYFIKNSDRIGDDL
jgi:lipopolysaccharide transport system permease protein